MGHAPPDPASSDPTAAAASGAAPPGAGAQEPDPRREAALLARALAGHLERRTHLGVRYEPRVPPPKDAPFPAAWIPPASPAGAAHAGPGPASGSAPGPLAPGHLVPRPPPVPAAPAELTGTAENRARALGCASLGELRRVVAACTACGLSRTRTQTVFSDGRDHARVLFVGEAPGQSEDEQGVPFVGAAGQLLTDIIEKGMGLPRSEVYIANVLKCRPPGNRDPEPEEKALCTPFLDRQIELVDPEVIVALGLHAAQHLLGSPLSMGRLRGKVHACRGRKVIATYHPAYLLRTPSAKKDCWQDIQLAMRELGLTPPPRGAPPPAR